MIRLAALLFALVAAGATGYAFALLQARTWDDSGEDTPVDRMARPFLDGVG